MKSYDSHKILLVDDEKAIRKVLSRLLATNELQVTPASTLEEAIACVNEQEFDLLIVDKNLPDGIGLDVVDFALKLGHHSEAIIITGYSDSESAARAASLGVFRYIRKPFDLESLHKDIIEALETGRLRRNLARRAAKIKATHVNNATDAILIYPLSEDGDAENLVEVNELACRWLERSREELMEMSMADLVTEESMASLSEAIKNLENKERVRINVEFILKDGFKEIVEVSSRLFNVDDKRNIFTIVPNRNLKAPV